MDDRYLSLLILVLAGLSYIPIAILLRRFELWSERLRGTRTPAE